MTEHKITGRYIGNRNLELHIDQGSPVQHSVILHFESDDEWTGVTLPRGDEIDVHFMREDSEFEIEIYPVRDNTTDTSRKLPAQIDVNVEFEDINDPQLEYLANLGQFCPFCGSANLTGESTLSEEGIITQPVHCSDCDRRWEDTYKLTGFIETDDGHE